MIHFWNLLGSVAGALLDLVGTCVRVFIIGTSVPT